MKSRSGFVSNSSSASFLLLGVVIDYKTLISKLGSEILNSITPEDRGWKIDDAIEKELKDKFGLSLNRIVNYFDHDSKDTIPTDDMEYVLGGNMKNKSLEDGELTDITPDADEYQEMKDKLEKFGLEGTKANPRIFVQYVSNDNC